MDKVARVLLIALSLFGAIFGGHLSLEHLHTGETCPVIVFIPACILVFLGYAIILLSTICRSKLKSGRVFYLGFIPVFALAAFGVILELSGRPTCPKAGDVPQCFYSLAMILTCLILYLFYNRRFAK